MVEGENERKDLRMRYKWKFTKEELVVLFQILKKEKPKEFIALEVEENDIVQICECWKKEHILKLWGNQYRLEEELQLALITILDCKAALFCEQQEKENGEKLGIYLHGQTIVIMQNEEDQNCQIVWVPFLPLAIGALSDQISEKMNAGQPVKIRGIGKSSFEAHIQVQERKENIEDVIRKTIHWLSMEYSIEMKKEKKVNGI